MNKQFKEIKFDDFARLKRGYDLPNPKMVPGIYPVVASTEIKGFHNQFKTSPPAVVTGRSGSLGTVQYIETECWPLNTSLYVKSFRDNHPKYVYYFLQMMHLENYNSGAGVPTLNQNHLHNQKIRIHSTYELQLKVSKILSNYDELIENNNKRIALLEQMAEQIYKEWFVRMRFPGYENTKFIKGIPEGWVVETLGKTVNVLMGQSPKSEFYNEDGVGLPFHQGVGSYGDVFPNHVTYCSVKGRLANEGDILFSVRAPVGRLNIADRKLIIGRGLSAMKHKKGYNSFLFHFLRHQFSREDIIGNGAIFNSVGKDELNGFKYFEPSDFLIQNFEKIVKPIDAEVKNLYQQIDQLRTTRNLLLPRLISGKLSVERLTSKLQETV
jgi:type I restriction enzyme S subunit